MRVVQLLGMVLLFAIFLTACGSGHKSDDIQACPIWSKLDIKECAVHKESFETSNSAPNITLTGWKEAQLEVHKRATVADASGVKFFKNGVEIDPNYHVLHETYIVEVTSRDKAEFKIRSLSTPDTSATIWVTYVKEPPDKTPTPTKSLTPTRQP